MIGLWLHLNEAGVNTARGSSIAMSTTARRYARGNPPTRLFAGNHRTRDSLARCGIDARIVQSKPAAETGIVAAIIILRALPASAGGCGAH